MKKTGIEHGTLTLAETAKRMGLSLSRVKQIEQQALEKLKKRKIQLEKLNKKKSSKNPLKRILATVRLKFLVQIVLKH